MLKTPITVEAMPKIEAMFLFIIIVFLKEVCFYNNMYKERESLFIQTQDFIIDSKL